MADLIWWSMHGNVNALCEVPSNAVESIKSEKINNNYKLERENTEPYVLLLVYTRRWFVPPLRDGTSMFYCIDNSPFCFGTNYSPHSLMGSVFPIMSFEVMENLKSVM